VRQRDFPHVDQNESDFSLGPGELKALNVDEVKERAYWKGKEDIDQAHATKEELHIDP